MNFKKLIVLVPIFATLICTSVFAKTEFSDIKADRWSYEDIMYLVEKGGIDGMPDGTFAPKNTVTREQFVKILIGSIYGKQEAVNNEHWAEPYIRIAKEKGIIYNTYYFSTSYLRERAITRKEMAAMIVNAMTVTGEKWDSSYSSYRYNLLDYESITEDYKMYITKAYAKGIITGFPDGTFKGDKEASREQAAAMITRLDKQEKRITPKKIDNKALFGSNASNIPNDLYEYSFNQKVGETTQMKFMSPVDTLNYFGISKLTKIHNLATTYVDAINNVDYNNMGNFEQNLSKCLAKEDTWNFQGHNYSTEEYIKAYQKYIKDNKIVRVSNIISSPYLIYFTDDSTFRVRMRLSYSTNTQNGEQKQSTKDIEIAIKQTNEKNGFDGLAFMKTVELQ